MVTDEALIAEGVARLTEALGSGKVQRARVQAELDRDTQVVIAREWLGDRDDEQRLITHGIKLRNEARRQALAHSRQLKGD